MICTRPSARNITKRLIAMKQGRKSVERDSCALARSAFAQ